MYIYQAAPWCDSCGQAICRRLGAKPIEPYDSDDYPKCVPESETDAPSHCNAGEACLEGEVLPSGRVVGCLLNESLTSDGVEYVRKAVKRGGEVAELWAERFCV